MQAYQQYLQQGEALVERERFGEAIQAFGEAARCAPDQKEPLTQLGLLSKQMGDADSALSFLKKAAELDATDAFVRLNLGLILNEEGRFEEAAQALKESILLIVHGVLATRMEVLISGHDQAEAILLQCDELEETAAQAKQLLEEIAQKLYVKRSA